MTLTVEDRPHALLELLWLREAHRLEPRGENLPPLLSATPADASIASDAALRSDWEHIWPQAWREALEYVGRDTDPRLFDRMQETADGSPERAALLREITARVALFGRMAPQRGWDVAIHDQRLLYGVGVTVLNPGGVATSIYKTELRRHADDGSHDARLDDWSSDERTDQLDPSEVAMRAITAVEKDELYAFIAQDHLLAAARHRNDAVDSALIAAASEDPVGP